MRLWQAAGIAAIVGSGCQDYDNLQQLYNARQAVIVRYADRNNDGILANDEVARLMGDIAKANGLKYYGSSFVDANGADLSVEKQTEMFKNYTPVEVPHR